MTVDDQADDQAIRLYRRRRIRASATLLVLVIVVIGAAWYSWHSVLDEEDKAAAGDEPTGESCAPGVPTAAPAPADIQLNVYNATDRRGLASDVADDLRARGFTIARIANDPLGRTVEGAAEIRSNADQQAAASLIASLVPGAAFVADDRSETVVDLVLGDAFEALAAEGAPVPAGESDLPACVADNE